MKALRREFTPRERILLLVLVAIIVALAYYLGIFSPVRSGIKSAKAEKEALQIEADAIDARLANMHEWEAEMDKLEANGHPSSTMPSYNASKDEYDFLHGILNGTMDFYVGFSDVTREGDQIRRSFVLNYTAANYTQAIAILDELENSEIRCLVGDFSVTPYSGSEGGSASVMSGAVTVNATATFYETMYGGTEDKDLPADTAPEEATVSEE